jgi:lysophospholipase L1-like esterase
VATSGHVSEEALAQLAETELHAADVLITSLGVNDVVDQIAPRQAMAALAAIDAMARERAGVRLSLHCAAPPMQEFPLLPQPLRWFFGRQAARFNAVLASSVAGQPQRRVAHMPESMQRNAAALMARDGFHPGPPGYAIWAEALAEQIASALQPAGLSGTR